MIIEVFQDTICPWCRIGKMNLSSALTQWKKEDVTINYRAFFLNESAPAEGYDFKSYLLTKSSGAVPLQYFFDGPRKYGEEAGLKFNFEQISRVPNTCLSHQLIALTPVTQKEHIIDKIYKAYFEECKDISKIDILCDIATTCGLEESNIREQLLRDEKRSEVLKEVKYAKELGITGVPFFIFDHRYAISGAQPVDAFLKIFDKILDTRSKENNDTMLLDSTLL